MRELPEGSDIARWRFQQKVMQKTYAPVPWSPWSIQSITPKSGWFLEHVLDEWITYRTFQIMAWPSPLSNQWLFKCMVHTLHQTKQTLHLKIKCWKTNQLLVAMNFCDAGEGKHGKYTYLCTCIKDIYIYIFVWKTCIYGYIVVVKIANNIC